MIPGDSRAWVNVGKLSSVISSLFRLEAAAWRSRRACLLHHEDVTVLREESLCVPLHLARVALEGQIGLVLQYVSPVLSSRQTPANKLDWWRVNLRRFDERRGQIEFPTMQVCIGSTARRSAPAAPAAQISRSLAAPRYNLSRPFAAAPNLFLMTV